MEHTVPGENTWQEIAMGVLKIWEQLPYLSPSNKETQSVGEKNRIIKSFYACTSMALQNLPAFFETSQTQVVFKSV